MTMRLWTLWPSVLLLLSACGQTPTSETSDTKHFFENSRRRAATDLERASLVRIGGCAGFYVANQDRQTVIGTARHCVNFKARDWCLNDGVHTDELGNAAGKCQGIVLGDSKHDIVFFKSSLPYPRDEHTLQLGMFVPDLDTPLVMLGYPADSLAQAKPTATDNCWIRATDMPSPHANTAEYVTGGLFDRSYHHNCSTYGGNSGGPMIIEGTRTVVGLPFTFHREADPLHLTPEPQTKADGFNTAAGAHVFDVVKANEANARLAKLILVAGQETMSDRATHAKAGTYSPTDSAAANCHLKVVPLYKSGTVLADVSVLFMGSACASAAEHYFQCQQDTCTVPTASTFNIKFEANNQLKYTFGASSMQFKLLPKPRKKA